MPLKKRIPRLIVSLFMANRGGTSIPNHHVGPAEITAPMTALLPVESASWTQCKIISRIVWRDVAEFRQDMLLPRSAWYFLTCLRSCVDKWGYAWLGEQRSQWKWQQDRLPSRIWRWWCAHGMFSGPRFRTPSGKRWVGPLIWCWSLWMMASAKSIRSCCFCSRGRNFWESVIFLSFNPYLRYPLNLGFSILSYCVCSGYVVTP